MITECRESVNQNEYNHCLIPLFHLSYTFRNFQLNWNTILALPFLERISIYFILGFAFQYFFVLKLLICSMLPNSLSNSNMIHGHWASSGHLHWDAFSKGLFLCIAVFMVLELKFYVFWHLWQCWYQWRKTCFLFYLAKLSKSRLLLFVWPCKYWHENAER